MNKAATVAHSRILPGTEVEIPESQRLGEDYLLDRAKMELLKVALERKAAKIFIQMKSESRYVMVISLEGQRYRFEISESAEKLKVGKAK